MFSLFSLEHKTREMSNFFILSKFSKRFLIHGIMLVGIIFVFCVLFVFFILEMMNHMKQIPLKENLLLVLPG